GSGVYAQRFNASGVAQGSEFLVNTTTSGDQTSPTVAMDNSGNFVIAWASSGQDGDGCGVYAQHFNAAGVAQGGEFRVNSTTAGDQSASSVAMDGNGNFLVTWASQGQDGDGSGVYAQQFDGTGAALGTEFRVNTASAGDQQDCSFAMD